MASIISLSAGSTIALASSGSRSSINSIEPLISANSAVTVLRSPSVTAEAICSAEIVMLGVLKRDDVDRAIAFLDASMVPQSPQKRLLGGFSEPHFGQWLVNGAPQSPQNLCPVGLSLPQFEQRISLPGVKRFAFYLPPPQHRDYRTAQSRTFWPRRIGPVGSAT